MHKLFDNYMQLVKITEAVDSISYNCKSARTCFNFRTLKWTSL